MNIIEDIKDIQRRLAIIEKNYLTGKVNLDIAEIYGYETGTLHAIAGAGIANRVQVTSFDTNSISKGITADAANNQIIINETAWYFLLATISAESSGGGGFEGGFGIFKNSGATLLEATHKHRDLSGGGGDTGVIALSGAAYLEKDDTIETWIWNEDSGTDYVIDDITMTAIRIYGA